MASEVSATNEAPTTIRNLTANLPFQDLSEFAGETVIAHMPELDGLDLIMELTREFLNVKVIAISEVPEYQCLLDAAKLLAVRQTLQKPFAVEELLSAVRYELHH